MLDLVIAKIDRLFRGAEFLLSNQKADVNLVPATMPSAKRFPVGIMATLAQKERELVSKRTKAALAAAKARGQKLWNPNGATCGLTVTARQSRWRVKMRTRSVL